MHADLGMAGPLTTYVATELHQQILAGVSIGL
jgi:hypothetical protein